MTTEISPLQSGNFAEMARAMGMSADMEKAPAKASTLPRLRIWNSPVMGQVEVKGKQKNMEIIPAGSFRLQLADGKLVYAEQANVRVFVQRFMNKRYDDKKNMYVKTLMAEDLNGDLKDNTGGYNCGKPAGFMANFKDLPKDQRDFILLIKRVRVLLGEVELINPVDEQGNDVELDRQSFIWEIDGKEAFKEMAEPFTTLGRQKRLPIQHWIKCTSTEGDYSAGMKYYKPVPSVDFSTTIDLEEADQQKFSDFIDWIGNYNQYIVDAHNKASSGLSADDETLVSEMIDIDEE